MFIIPELRNWSMRITNLKPACSTWQDPVFFFLNISHININIILKLRVFSAYQNFNKIALFPVWQTFNVLLAKRQVRSTLLHPLSYSMSFDWNEERKFVLTGAQLKKTFLNVLSVLSAYALHIDWYPRNWEEGTGSPASGIGDSCEPPCGYWGPNPDFLQEQPMLLTTVPSL